MASVRKLQDGRWQARYRAVPGGRQYSKTTALKRDAETWLKTETAKLVTGTWTEPKTARMTVSAWCEEWLRGYGTRRASTVRQAKTHIARIEAEFGDMPLSSVRPSHVKTWTAKLLDDGYEASYVYALHGRLSQVFSDAVHDGIVPRSPCSRRTSPGQGKQRPYVATSAQVWALHDAMPERYRVAILLGAFVGLRTAETCGLRIGDVDFMRGVVSPAVQYPAEPLKTETSRTAVPIPRNLALELAAHVERYPAETLLSDETAAQVGPWRLERAFRSARSAVAGLPDGFRYHGPTALLREPAHRLRRGCEDGAGAATARLSQDHVGHLRAHVARP